MKNCFIISPIGSDNSEIRKRSDLLFKHVISPVCTACSFKPIRIDKENTNGSLTEEIISHINNDDLVIADITDGNPNAFYEIGYRAALKKPSIHLMLKDSKIPFDISSIRTFPYDLSDLDAVDELKNRLIKTIQSIEFDVSNINNSSENPSSSNIPNTQILQEIYNLEDRIEKLCSIIETKDSSTVSVLADKLASTNVKTSEAVMLEILLPKLMENPALFDKLKEISKE